MEQIKIPFVLPELPSAGDSANRKVRTVWTEVQGRAMKKFSSWKKCFFLTFD